MNLWEDVSKLYVNEMNFMGYEFLQEKKQQKKNYICILFIRFLFIYGEVILISLVFNPLKIKSYTSLQYILCLNIFSGN